MSETATYPASLIITIWSSVKQNNKALLVTIRANLVFDDDIRGFKKWLDAGR